MRTLHELPRFRDRWSHLYLEMGRLDVDANGLVFQQGESSVRVPIDQLSIIMLGRGKHITHAAVKSLSQNNCLLSWTAAGWYSALRGKHRWNV